MGWLTSSWPGFCIKLLTWSEWEARERMDTSQLRQVGLDPGLYSDGTGHVKWHLWDNQRDGIRDGYPMTLGNYCLLCYCLCKKNFFKIDVHWSMYGWNDILDMGFKTSFHLGFPWLFQWLRLHAANNAWVLGSIPGGENRSHRLQLKIWHATTKTEDPTGCN